MLKNFMMNLSTRIEFGEGKILGTGETARELGLKKTVIITDKGLAKTDIMAAIKDSLYKSNVDYIVYDKVRENPRDVDAQAAGEFARDEKVDSVIACGGGSSMDLAKAVAAMLTNPGDIKSIMKPNKVTNDPVPLICIPTTAGTGSEVTSFAVLTIEAEGRKSSIFDDKIRPTVAINDPQVLRSLPSSVAAATSMDALTHAIEAYTCKLANPLTDGMALQSIRYISRNISDFIHERSEESCINMMAGSLMAGIAFGFSDIAGVHCMAEALGGMYDTPHGVANAIFLPIVFEYNIDADVRRHRDVAEALGICPCEKSAREVAEDGARWLASISKELNIPKLKELGYVEPKNFEALAELCMKNVSLPSNARELSKIDFINLYAKAYEM